MHNYLENLLVFFFYIHIQYTMKYLSRKLLEYKAKKNSLVFKGLKTLNMIIKNDKQIFTFLKNKERELIQLKRIITKIFLFTLKNIRKLKNKNNDKKCKTKTFG